MGGGFTHAEADFQNQLAVAAIGGCGVQRSLLVLQQEARTQFFKALAWPVVVRPGAAHIAFDGLG
jgi:hypothetical protein